MRSDRSMHPHGTFSPISSSATTGFTVAAGASATTRCWCIGYHPECGQKGISHRAVKEDRVRTGRAHAALVLDADGAAQGWCQYGSPEELSNIKHKREYDKDAPTAAGLADHLHLRGQEASRPRHRPGRPGGSAGSDRPTRRRPRRGHPQVTAGREAQGRFLFSATVELFEQYGFTRVAASASTPGS